MNRYQTYNEIIRYLEEFATQHRDVMRFKEEDEDQMSNLTAMDETFPMMFVTPVDTLFNYDLNEYSLRVYCYDRLMKDRSNSQNIRSKTNLILNDLDVWLRKEHTLPFEITDTTSAVPFSSELMTDVTGWYIEITIDNPSFSVCEIPFIEVPQLPLGVYNPSTGNFYDSTLTIKDTDGVVIHSGIIKPREDFEYVLDCQNFVPEKITIVIGGHTFEVGEGDEIILMDENGDDVTSTQGLNSITIS